MENNFEQTFPIEFIIVGFLVLLVGSSFLRKKLRKLALQKQGQILDNTGKIPTIEERLAKNKEWQSGQITSAGTSMFIALWLLTIVWNLTFGVSFIKSISNPEMKIGAIIVLGFFAILGIFPTFFAIRETIRRYRYGRSYCLIQNKAGVLGDKLSGTIRTDTEIKVISDYKITVQCLESYTTGTGKQRRTELKTHWEGTQNIAAAGKNSKLGILFSIDIPKHLPETADLLARGQVSWQLRIDAETQGVDYCAIFIIPVFKMAWD